MMKKYIPLLLIPLLLVCGKSFAQDVSFQVRAPKVVAKGERFRLSYSLNAKGENFRYGDLKGLSVLSGPSMSSSSSVQIINGKVSQNVSYAWNFVVQANEEGKVSLPPATVKVDGEEYRTRPFEIEVVAGSAPGSQQGVAGSGGTGQQPAGEISDKDLFTRIVIDKSSVYQGEHLVATLKVYTRVDLAGFEDIKFPSFTGFWTEEIPVPEQIQLQREVVNGEVYNSGVLKKVLLFPQRGGKITIDPLEVDCIVRQRVQRQRRQDPFSVFDDFFASPYQNVLKQANSPKVTINVKPLPYQQPESFNGAVGKLSMQASADLAETTTNEPVTLKVQVKGNGNLKLVDPPSLNFPADFEAYDPKVSNSLKATAAGLTGSKTFEYLLIPRHHGNYTIPPVEFSYLNPQTGKYETLTSEAFDITVKRGEEEGVAMMSPEARKEGVSQIGSDIRYLKTGIILSEPSRFFFGTTVFYAGFVVPLAIFGGFMLYMRKKRHDSENITLLKNRKAAKMARQRLKTAEPLLKNGKKDAFYREVSTALWGYLSDKLNLSKSELNKDRVRDELMPQVEEELVNNYLQLMDDCEFAQFAPAEDAGEMDRIYESAIEQIARLDEELGKRKVTA